MMRKLEFKKQTIANLSKDEMSDIKAAGDTWPACWENLWTIYYCGVVCTGESFDPRKPI